MLKKKSEVRIPEELLKLLLDVYFHSVNKYEVYLSCIPVLLLKT